MPIPWAEWPRRARLAKLAVVTYDVPDPDLMEHARSLIEEAKRITVLTGAGISTDSGIPDFRGPQGVWTRNPGAEKRATIQNYVADRDIRVAAWRNRLDSRTWSAEPNDSHRALVRLERKGKLRSLLTQNVDGLHHAAGSAPERIVEIHGSVRNVGCLSCSYEAPMSVALDRIRGGEDDPECPECGGILKSTTISFGQSLVSEDIERAQVAAHECDLMLTIGTTLGVYPIAGVVPIAAGRGAPVIIVNGEPTEMDHLAEVVVRGAIGQILPELW
ncbi:MAG: NAD-dependent deacetylase [Actinomycetia bacterium]|nr:NAD-dependent deacetylase [Actinomycetes bacterium]MCP4958385.1 NAD-dependent deacetylase [Actinomycetes bacterium]